MPKKKGKNLLDMIDLYRSEAREEVMTFLLEDHKFDKKSATRAEEEIYLSTNSKMREKYTFSDPFFWLSENENDLTKTTIAKSQYPPDFVGWTVTALSVPFYQSLGDTIGYGNSDWEFNFGETNAGPDYVNVFISKFIALGGINDLSITNWKASDDTILYFATLYVLSHPFNDVNDFGNRLRNEYVNYLPKIQNRFPGETTNSSLEIQKNIEWDKLPYNSRAIGNGSAMRSGCIGIFYPGRHNRKMLISLAVESSRITHNSATAILGSVTAALFTAYALEKIPINLWPHKLLKLLRSDVIDQYMQKSRPNEYAPFSRDKIIFISQWEKYVSLLFSGINPRTDLKMMDIPVQRYKYLTENFSKGCDTPGGCADDALIMAYHALLQSDGVFEKIVVYSILHPGDSDTVGSIALSWFGAYYHSSRNQMIIGNRFKELEFYRQLDSAFDANIMDMVKVYYYDIYIHIAMKYLKQIIGRK